MIKMTIKTVANIILLLCTITHAKANDVEKEVLLAFNGLVEASKYLDIDAYFSYFDESKFVGLNSDGSNWNSLQDLRTLIIPAFSAIKKVISLDFNNVNVSVIDDQTAVLVNQYQQTVLMNNGSTITFAGGGTQVWSRYSGRWQLVSVSASQAP